MTTARTNYAEFVGPQFRVMSDPQLQQVHWATLEVLERTGGGATLGQRVRQRLSRILEEHHPSPHPPAVEQRIREIAG